MSAAGFEARFYERRAQRHLLALAAAPVWINVPWGLSGNPATRPEIDAVLVKSGRAVAAEVKAHPVDEPAARQIAAKYQALGFRDLIVIAPRFTPAAARFLAASRQPAVERIAYSPDLSEIADFYHGGGWQEGVPGWVHRALATGLHHVRFILTVPYAPGRFAVGQRRTRVYDTGTVSRAIAQLPSPPARVLWAPQRFTIPRDLSARRSRLTALGGYVAVDIDGDRLHRADHACQLTPAAAGCQHCLLRARRELARLSAALGDPGWTDVLLSGGRGVHAYLPDHGHVRSRVLAAAAAGSLRIDEAVTASVKSTIALPGSLNAANGQQVAPAGTPSPPRAAPVAAAC